jgi:putative membrane protein
MLPLILAANDHWDGPGHWWPIFPIVWFLFIVFLVVMFVRYRGHSHRGSYAGESRLAERYAAGEIDEAEYRERMAVLRSSNAKGGGR